MESKRCYGCMRMKSSSPICEHCGYDERTPNAPHQLPPGTILRGQYMVGKVLGQGGFGITYLGRDINLDTPIAIKEYYPTGVVTRETGHSNTVTVATGGNDTRFVENRDRFLREARTLARLEDVPEVVQVKNFFAENNTAYIIMGYVKGITLKEHMRRRGGRLSAEETFRLLEPLMEALGQVHELGLVHRDISPDNIMLQPNKRARLIDFGAAHAATAAGDKSTQAVLKHGFAPVEQYQSRGQLGPWTDVYAICATIYHLITGLQPPNATDRMMGDEEFRWDAVSGFTPEQLETLKRGLSLSHTQRIRTMQELCAGFFGKEEAAAAEEEPAWKTEEPATVLQPPEEELPETREVNREPVSSTGTVALVRSEEPASYTAPLDPVERKEVPANQNPYYTVPVEPEKKPVLNVTAPVEREPVAKQPEKPAENKYYTVPVEPDDKPALNVTAPLEPETKEKQPEKPADNWKKPVFACIAAALLLLVALLIVVPNWQRPDESVFVPPVESELAAEEAQTVTGSRVLMNPDPIYKEVSDGEYTWDEFDEEANYAFGTKALRKEVASITILDTTQNAPEDAVDASQNQDGSVLAWVVPNGNLYDLYLAADGDVIAPASCWELFAYYSSLTSIELTGLDTSHATDMRSMFSCCYSLTKLDVSGFDTSNVTDMWGMFISCHSLTMLDLSSFDTSGVTSMGAMFLGCDSFTELDVSGFDTSSVTNMSAMFNSCDSLKNLDVSGFDTSNVTDMSYMFSGMPSISNIQGNFDVSNVEFFEDFMDLGDTFNGRPWKELFR